MPLCTIAIKFEKPSTIVLYRPGRKPPSENTVNKSSMVSSDIAPIMYANVTDTMHSLKPEIMTLMIVVMASMCGCKKSSKRKSIAAIMKTTRQLGIGSVTDPIVMPIKIDRSIIQMQNHLRVRMNMRKYDIYVYICI